METFTPRAKNNFMLKSTRYQTNTSQVIPKVCVQKNFFRFKCHGEKSLFDWFSVGGTRQTADHGEGAHWEGALRADPDHETEERPQRQDLQGHDGARQGDRPVQGREDGPGGRQHAEAIHGGWAGDKEREQTGKRIVDYCLVAVVTSNFVFLFSVCMTILDWMKKTLGNAGTSLNSSMQKPKKQKPKMNNKLPDSKNHLWNFIWAVWRVFLFISCFCVYSFPQIKDLDEYLRDPLLRLCLVKDLPCSITRKLFEKRRYLFSLQTTANLMCALGLCVSCAQHNIEKEMVRGRNNVDEKCDLFS